jgi:predicted ATPase
VISAPDYPEALYTDGPVVMAFRRAASRLAEMQSW